MGGYICRQILIPVSQVKQKNTELLFDLPGSGIFFSHKHHLHEGEQKSLSARI